MVSWNGHTIATRAERDLKKGYVTDEAILRRHSLALSKGFQKCAFRISIWRIVPSKIVIFIRQMASCLH
jgi:hypothetical protein